ncbi:thioredoxin-like protein [Fimicolochytrium jonesii]|uniref:thioredoxin-like protein n=1 Tax=Fimicolochytrium jonesii TaxID=1396493 RepID=UPI0022FEB3EA|nr:thioredoxin-like protein [Fimicolochytrium jonesii]KAI8817994.1 thioredoxin-like protein [Fimicolochytrium jonesii]
MTQLTRPHSPPSKPRLYRTLQCPHAQRVAWALRSLGIDHEIVEIDLANKPEWYPEVNPRATVPALELPDGKVLIESSEIVYYLEEAYGSGLEGKSLLSKGPVRALSNSHHDLYICGQGFSSAYGAFVRNTDRTKKDEIHTQLLSALKDLINTFPATGLPSKLAIIHIFPHLWRLNVVGPYWRGLDIPKNKDFQPYWNLVEAASKDEGFLKTRPEEEDTIKAYGKWYKERI